MAARVLNVATDYSGIETPLIALQVMGIATRHLFSSESNPRAREVIRRNFAPEVLFPDALKRRSRHLPAQGTLDLYVAGFPCQRFTPLRNLSPPRQGLEGDPLEHFRACLRAIRRCLPRIFVLENVPTFVTYANGTPYQKCVRLLRRLGHYHCSSLLLDASDYGSPQPRKRLFLVGLRRDCAREALAPPPRLKARSFAQLAEKRARSPRLSLPPKTAAKLHACVAKKKPTKPFFVEMSWGVRKCQLLAAPPTLLAHPASGLYSSSLNRRSSVREEMRLQGLPDSFAFPASLPPTAIRRLLGNAMSVDVLRALFAACLRKTKTH